MARMTERISGLHRGATGKALGTAIAIMVVVGGIAAAMPTAAMIASTNGQILEDYEDETAANGQIKVQNEVVYRGDFSGLENASVVNDLTWDGTDRPWKNATMVVRVNNSVDTNNPKMALMDTTNSTSFTDNPNTGRVQPQSDGTVDHWNGSVRTTICSAGTFQPDTWYLMRFEQIDWTNDSFTFTLYDANGTAICSKSGLKFDHSFSDAARIISQSTDKQEQYFDNIMVNKTVDRVTSAKPVLSGNVTDRTDDPIANATVEAKQNGSVVASTTTNSTGHYNLSLKDGTYNVTADKDDYNPETHEVTLSGNDKNQDFTLVAKDSNLVIDTRTFLRHGETRPYTIYYFERDGNTTELERYDVTANATLTSNNTKAIAVDSTKHELVATENESINAKVLITAEYQRDNETYTATENVTVANLTLDNIKILPGAYRLNATFSSPPDSEANPMLVIIIATLVGIVGARASSSFGGLSLMTMAVMVAWFGGFISHGIMLVTIVTATFIGLNVAGNINYSVHR